MKLIETEVNNLYLSRAVTTTKSKPSASKYSIDTLQGAKEVLALAMQALELPSGKSRPFLNVSSLLKETAVAPVAFTESELCFIQNLCQVQTQSCQAVVYPRGMFEYLLDIHSMTNSDNHVKWFQAGASCHLQKMIKFSTDLDVFKE